MVLRGWNSKEAAEAMGLGATTISAFLKGNRKQYGDRVRLIIETFVTARSIVGKMGFVTKYKPRNEFNHFAITETKNGRILWFGLMFFLAAMIWFIYNL